MGGWVDRFGAILLDASLAATAVLSLVALAMLANVQPGRRIALGRAGVLTCLLVWPLVGLAPLPRVAVRDLLRRSPLGASPLLDAGGVGRSPGQRAWPGGASGALVPRARDRVTAASTPSHRVARVVVPLYLAGVALRLGWLVLGYWGVRWVMRSSLPPTADAAMLYQGLQAGGPGPAPALRVSHRVRRPVLVGLFRQTILIPAPLGQPEATSQLRLSLLHELAHAQTRDSAFGLASGLAQAVWFFLPPLWWILAQMRLDQEFLADRRAAGEFGTPPTYAASLVNLAGPKAPVQSTRQAAGPRGETRGSALFQRVLMLVHCPFPIEARPPLWWRWSLLVVVLLGTVGASVLTVRSPSGAASSAPRQTAPGSVPRTFRMSRLVVYPRPVQGQGRTAFFEVPIRLPEAFELGVEAWGTPASLAETRIVGRNLGDPDQPPPPQPSPAGWHRVRIRHDPQGLLAIWVDDQLVVPPAPASTPGWLTFEAPANRVAQFRNLVLTW